MPNERPAELAGDPPSRREWAVLFGAYALACVVYATYALLRHARFETAGFDLGIFDHSIWRWSQFLGPENTVRRVPSLFGDHFSPVLLLLVPLRWIGFDERGLLIAQPLIACAGAFPIFAFARRRLPFLAAVAFPLAFLSSWGLAQGMAFDIHEVAFACLALSLTINFFDKGAKWPFWIALAFWLFTKEDQGLTIACLGLLALTRRQWSFGGGIVLAGLGTFLVTTRVVIPHFAGGHYSHWLYGHLGPTALSAALYVVTHPLAAVKIAITPTIKVGTLVRFFAAYAFLPVFSPYLIVLVAPLLALLLSNTPSTWGGQYHYWMSLSAGAALAGADGFSRLLQYVEGRRGSTINRKQRFFALMAVVGASLVTSLFAKIPQKNLARASAWQKSTVAVEGSNILALVPPSASVSATNNALGHLSGRRSAYLLRYGWSYPDPYPPLRAQYVVVDPYAFAIARERTDCHPFADPDYQLVRRSGNWFLFVLRDGIQPFDGFRPVEPGTDVMREGAVFDRSARG